MSRWKPSEDAYLREHYGTMSSREIGRHLKRTHSSVIDRWARLQGHRQEMRVKTISGSLEYRNRLFVAALIRAAREEGLLAA